MKKRLLITSIVMMLVVAVALSTATYAWFTSNATVQASSVTMTAAVNSEAAIGIAWVGDSATKAPIVAIDSGNINPMIPTSYTVGTTKDSEMGYAASTVYTDNNGSTYKFNAAGTTETPYIWNGVDGESTPVETFYIRNLSATTAVDITISVAISDYVADATVEAVAAGTTLTAGVDYYKKNGADDYTKLVGAAEAGDGVDFIIGTDKAGEGAGNIGYDVYVIKTDISNLIRVAVFTCDTVDGNYVLSNVFTELGGDNDHKNVSAGTITKDSLTSTVKDTKTSIVQNEPTSLKANLAGATNVYVRVHVWIDGDGFVDVLGGGKANVALTFDAAKA